jgi:uncharacterized protein YecT (DUF1311 family)
MPASSALGAALRRSSGGVIRHIGSYRAALSSDRQRAEYQRGGRGAQNNRIKKSSDLPGTCARFLESVIEHSRCYDAGALYITLALTIMLRRSLCMISLAAVLGASLSSHALESADVDARVSKCSKDAGYRKGEERKSFISKCLGDDAAAVDAARAQKKVLPADDRAIRAMEADSRGYTQKEIRAEIAKGCDGGGNLTVCAWYSYYKKDVVLNDTYRELMRRLVSSELKASLRNSQKAWLDYRRAQCTFSSGNWESGAVGRSVETAWCWEGMADARIKEFVEILTCRDAPCIELRETDPAKAVR